MNKLEIIKLDSTACIPKEYGISGGKSSESHLSTTSIRDWIEDTVSLGNISVSKPAYYKSINQEDGGIQYTCYCASQ